jgi:septal ring factor EnvC (AmiA/AmiB activator)
MIRKLLVGAVILVVGILILRKTWVGNTVQAWWDEAREEAESKVPPEQRIKQLRKEIGKIDGEVKKVVNSLIKMEVARNDLRDEVARLEKAKTARMSEVESMKTALEGAANTVIYQKQSYRPAVFQDKLDQAIAQLKTTKDTLRLRQQALQSKEESLSTLDRRISAMRGKKIELTALADKLETKLEELRLKQLENRIEVDDSKVSECEALYTKIKRGLEEEEMKAEKYSHYGLTTKVSAPDKDRKPVSETLKNAREALEDEDVKAPAVPDKK